MKRCLVCVKTTTGLGALVCTSFSRGDEEEETGERKQKVSQTRICFGGEKGVHLFKKSVRTLKQYNSSSS